MYKITKTNHSLLVFLPAIAVITLLVLFPAPSFEAAEVITQTESPITVIELATMATPGFFQIFIPSAGTGNIINAVSEVSTYIDTGAQGSGATVTLTTLDSTETRSGKLPSASYQCIPGKILKLATSETLNNFNIKIYFDQDDISLFQENTLQLFFYEDQTAQNAWIERPIALRGVDTLGAFVQTTAPRTLDPTKLPAEYFCIGGIKK